MKHAWVRALFTFGLHFVLGALGLVATWLVARSLGVAMPLETSVRFDVVGAIALGGVVAAIEALSQRGDDTEARRGYDRFLAAATGASLSLVMWGGPIARSLTDRAPSAALELGGAVLVVTGALVRGRSIRVLGNAFVTDPDCSKGRELVRGDVYAIVRHPSELGLYLVCLGMTLLCPSLVTCGGAAILVVLSILRLRREEAELRAALGMDYERYAGEVPAVIPGSAWERGSGHTRGAD